MYTALPRSLAKIRGVRRRQERRGEERGGVKGNGKEKE